MKLILSHSLDSSIRKEKKNDIRQTQADIDRHAGSDRQTVQAPSRHHRQQTLCSHLGKDLFLIVAQEKESDTQNKRNESKEERDKGIHAKESGQNEEHQGYYNEYDSNGKVKFSLVHD